MIILFDLFPNIREYLQLFPIAVVGIIAGCVSYFGGDGKDIKRAFKAVFTSLFLTLVVFSILSATDLPYLAKVGISACIGYFGVDRALELVQKVLALKNNNPNSDKK